jgi:hypothetical protein
MQSFLVAFLPLFALMLSPLLIILLAWAVGTAKDAIVGRSPLLARER